MRLIIVVGFCLALAGTNTAFAKTKKNVDRPNFIVIFADDLGYGDLGAFGNPSIKTPNLDRMAVEGQKWTSFYVAASVCSPSRAALLTGRLPKRTGITGVLFPNQEVGLPQSERTIARILKENGYQTAAVGKWHLGHQAPFLPTDHGFDSYYGLPYSNDMNRTENVEGEDWIEGQITLAERENYAAYNVPLMRNNEIIERPADQRTLTKRYTQEAVSQIKQLKGEPFFLYLAHSLPHIPLFRSGEFKNVSSGGLYGDVIEEIDWSVGQILKTLKEEKLDKQTLVVFCSDNGPWHIFKSHAGSAGPLQGGKGGTFEGGFRVPTIFWWPGKVKPQVVMDMGCTMDLLPTFCQLSGSALPDDRILDGYDLSGVLKGEGKSHRDVMFYYRGNKVYAIRKGDYKMHFITQLCWCESRTSLFLTDPPIEINKTPTVLSSPLLFNVNEDPAERYNIAGENPGIVAEIRAIYEEHLAGQNP